MTAVLSADVEAALRAAAEHTVTYAVRVVVGSHQPETEIRRQIADGLRDQATRLERGEFVVPENDAGSIARGDDIQRVALSLDVTSFVHTYKGEGLTACGLEVVGPCPDCETRKSNGAEEVGVR